MPGVPCGDRGNSCLITFDRCFSLAGNFLIVQIVYKTPTLKKPVNMLKYVDRKHGHLRSALSNIQRPC